jgi:hypothetical protein
MLNWRLDMVEDNFVMEKIALNVAANLFKTKDSTE